MASTDILIYDSIAASNIPKREKSVIQSWVDSVTGIAGPRGQYHSPAGHLAGFVGTLRQYSEGVAVGAALGALHAELKNGLDVGGAPIDGAAGFVAGGLAMFFGGTEAGTTLNNIGSHSSCVYSFRSIHKLRAEMLRAKGRVPGGVVSGASTKASTIAGEDDEDPIVIAARNMGRANK